MKAVGRVLFRCAMRSLAGLLALTSLWLSGVAAAHACSCEAISPAVGFDRAQYVFTGTIVEAGTHTWVVEVDRVWKGQETLTRSARLMDVYAQMGCEFFFKQGERYLFFAILAKGSRDVFYHPQACNWTSPLRSKRVLTPEGVSLWLEDLIVSEHGPGEPPGSESGSGRLP
jgi:hypothetical protein